MDNEEHHPHKSSSLHSPLIRHGVDDDAPRASESNDVKAETGKGPSCCSVGKEEVFEEIKKQLWLAVPLISVNLLLYCIQIVSVMFVGHLGELALSGASMATSFASVTGYSLLTGMASALDTFCGQSYGAKQYQMLGVYTQRAMAILLLVSLPLAVMWANTELILVTLGQHPEIAREAGTYAKYMIPSLFAYGPLQCLVKFLQTQNIVFPMMISSGIATLLHIPFCWALVFKSGLGFRGAAVANSISYWLNVLLMAMYVKYSPSCSKTWTGFTKEALHNVLAFIRLAIPSAVMVCLEGWSFEMMVLLSGLLPNPTLESSVLSISLNTSSTFWRIPFGLSGAVSTRVSNELGAGKPQTARLAVRVALAMAVTEGILIGAVLILMRNIWGYAYSNEKEVVRYLAVMMPILAASHLLDALPAVLSGVARGCGWQKIGAYVNLGSFYIVGIPSAILLAFVFHLGGRGLWLGIISALTVQLFSLLLVTIRTNWDEEAKKATERVFASILPVGGVA